MAALEYDELIEALTKGDFDGERVDRVEASSATGEPFPAGGPSEAREEPANPLPAGSSLVDEFNPVTLGSERGYLTFQDVPELQRRLEVAGWKVTRKGNELVCQLSRKLRVQ